MRAEGTDAPLSAQTHEELLDVISGVLDWVNGDPRAKEAEAAVAELRHRMSPGAYWPQKTFEAAQTIFGPAVFNTASRTYQALDRRIRFALRVWDEKYGPLTPDQEIYADDVLASVLRKAQADAGGAKAKLWPYAQAGIGRVVHHDRVVDGMRKRAGYVDPAAILAGLAAD